MDRKEKFTEIARAQNAFTKTYMACEIFDEDVLEGIVARICKIAPGLYDFGYYDEFSAAFRLTNTPMEIDRIDGISDREASDVAECFRNACNFAFSGDAE